MRRRTLMIALVMAGVLLLCACASAAPAKNYKAVKPCENPPEVLGEMVGYDEERIFTKTDYIFRGKVLSGQEYLIKYVPDESEPGVRPGDMRALDFYVTVYDVEIQEEYRGSLKSDMVRMLSYGSSYSPLDFVYKVTPGQSYIFLTGTKGENAEKVWHEAAELFDIALPSQTHYMAVMQGENVIFNQEYPFAKEGRHLIPEIQAYREEKGMAEVWQDGYGVYNFMAEDAVAQMTVVGNYDIKTLQEEGRQKGFLELDPEMQEITQKAYALMSTVETIKEKYSQADIMSYILPINEYKEHLMQLIKQYR